MAAALEAVRAGRAGGIRRGQISIGLLILRPACDSEVWVDSTGGGRMGVSKWPIPRTGQGPVDSALTLRPHCT